MKTQSYRKPWRLSYDNKTFGSEMDANIPKKRREKWSELLPDANTEIALTGVALSPPPWL